MAEKSQQHICPTCFLEQPPDQASLAYFAMSAAEPPSADDVSTLYEDTYKVLHFLGALAQAAPRAVAHAGDGATKDDWVMWLAWLAEELTEEAARRLLRVQEAGLSWQERTDVEKKRNVTEKA